MNGLSSLRVSWFVWSLYTVAWTASLLLPVPVQPGEGLRSPASLFAIAKTTHIAAYALFAVLTGWLASAAGHRLWLLAFVVVHAGATEFLQWLLPTGRTGCLRDVGLNLVGITLGVALGWRWWFRAARPETFA